MFAAQLKTKDTTQHIICSTFSEAWQTLGTLRDGAKSLVLEALVLKEGLPIASMRIIK